MSDERACQLRGALRLLHETGVFIAEIRYFSVKCDYIRELTCKVKACSSFSMPPSGPPGLGKLTKPAERSYSSSEV